MHEVTTEGGKNRWNRVKFTLYPDGKFNIDFEWDQALFDEIGIQFYLKPCDVSTCTEILFLKFRMCHSVSQRAVRGFHIPSDHHGLLSDKTHSVRGRCSCTY